MEKGCVIFISFVPTKWHVKGRKDWCISLFRFGLKIRFHKLSKQKILKKTFNKGKKVRHSFASFDHHHALSRDTNCRVTWVLHTEYLWAFHTCLTCAEVKEKWICNHRTWRDCPWKKWDLNRCQMAWQCYRDLRLALSLVDPLFKI